MYRICKVVTRLVREYWGDSSGLDTGFVDIMKSLVWILSICKEGNATLHVEFIQNVKKTYEGFKEKRIMATTFQCEDIYINILF